VPLVQVIAGRDGRVRRAELDRQVRVALDAELQRLGVEVGCREHLPADLEDRHLVPEREILHRAGQRQACRLELMLVHDSPSRSWPP